MKLVGGSGENLFILRTEIVRFGFKTPERISSYSMDVKFDLTTLNLEQIH